MLLMYKIPEEKGAKRIEMGAHETTRGNGHHETRELPSEHGKTDFHSEGDQAVAQVVQGGCRVSILGCIQRLPG